MTKKIRVLIEMQPRGLDRRQASAYVNLSTTKFDQLVAEGRMPSPKQIDNRKVWDRLALDLAFDSFPGGDDFDLDNPWDLAA